MQLTGVGTIFLTVKNICKKGQIYLVYKPAVCVASKDSGEHRKVTRVEKGVSGLLFCSICLTVV